MCPPPLFFYFQMIKSVSLKPNGVNRVLWELSVKRKNGSAGVDLRNVEGPTGISSLAGGKNEGVWRIPTSTDML